MTCQQTACNCKGHFKTAQFFRWRENVLFLVLPSCGESTLLIARQVPCTATLISGPLLKRINIGKGGIVLRLFFFFTWNCTGPVRTALLHSCLVPARLRGRGERPVLLAVDEQPWF